MVTLTIRTRKSIIYDIFFNFQMSQQSLESIFAQAQKGNQSALSKLLSYGRHRGFDTFINRKLIWPFLLGIDTNSLGNSIYEWQGELDRNSQDFQQLQKDAERSLANMKTFEHIAKFHLQKKQRDVLKILDSFFAKNKTLRYIQGFHDVASIFLVLFGNNTGYYMMEKAGRTYFKDFLTKDIGAIGTIVSDIVLELLAKRDPEFKEIFECFVEMRMLTFIIPWILTWFSHDFTSAKTICRIWDYLLCTGTHGIIYLTAGIFLATKQELIQKCQQFDQASIQTFYQQKVKNQSIDIQQSIKMAIELQHSFAIQSLESSSHFDADSIFLSHNFELHLDLHRRVSQYNKIQASKEQLKRKVFFYSSIATLAMAGILYYRFSKR